MPKPKSGQIVTGYGAPQVQIVTHAKTAVRGRKPADLLYGQIAVGYEYREPTLWIKNTRDEIVAINPQATVQVRGMAQIATRNEALNGTNNKDIITPKRLAQVLQELNIGGSINGGDAQGNVWIDGGSAAQNNFTSTIDGGIA